MVGIEPTDQGVKTPCLTSWLHPNISPTGIAPGHQWQVPVTKDELFSKIWDMESIGDIATVTVHIKKIREKIEFNTAKPQYIETIWGVGYRFKL